MSYYEKYLKYKHKYMLAKKTLYGGSNDVYQITSPYIDDELKKELDELNNGKFSLAEFALERRKDNDIAIITKGPNMTGQKIQYTYKNVKDHAKYVASIFADYGKITKGDKVLLLQYNSWDLVVCYWAVHYLGAVAICAVPQHKERIHLLRYTNCKVIVAPQHILNDLKQEITDKTNVNLVYVTDINENNYKPETITVTQQNNDTVSNEDNLFEKITRTSSSYDIKYFTNILPSEDIIKMNNTKIKQIMETINNTDECLWYFTSGTTGKPKGCVHKQIDLAFAGITYGKRVMLCKQGKITATDTMMAGPYAMGSNMIFPFIAGCTVIMDHIIDQSINKPEKIITEFDKINLYVSIPSNISKIIDLLNDKTKTQFHNKMESVEVITSAGAVLPASTYLNFNYVAKTKNLQTKVIDGIGTSELQHIFISNFVDDIVTPKSSVGKLVPGYEAILIKTKNISENEIQGELGIRADNDNISVKYSSERQPTKADYDNKTKEVNFTYNNKNYYITGDIAMVKKNEPYFYLLGRTSELGSQIGSDDRPINDYIAVSNSNKIMMSAGLFENMSKVNSELYDSTNTINEVLVSDVFPIKLDNGENVYVISVNKTHWDKMTKEQVEKWNKYIINNSKIHNLNLIFQYKENIPRTQPPLLKPLKNKMKEFIEIHEKICGDDKKTPWYYLSSIPMANTPTNITNITNNWCQ